MFNLKLICTITNNADLVPAFLEHYTAQGVTHFYFFRYASADIIVVPEKFKEQVTIVNSCCVEGVVEYDYNVLNPPRLLQKIFVRADEWHITADLDEFSVMPDGQRLVDVIEECERKGLNYISGYFVDRFAVENKLPDKLEGNIWKQFPKSGDFTQSVVKGCTEKCVATKGNIYLNAGHHNADKTHAHLVKPYPIKAKVNHFKWWGNILVRLHKRYYERKTLIPNYEWAEECIRVCKYFNYKYLQEMIDLKPPVDYK
jgi:hypothetical protein